LDYAEWFKALVGRVREIIFRIYGMIPIGPRDVIRIVLISYNVVLSGGLISPPAIPWRVLEMPSVKELNRLYSPRTRNESGIFTRNKE
jgi:hypothetical protein